MILDGEERGLAKGLKQGRAETAERLIALGVDEEVVTTATGLSSE